VYHWQSPTVTTTTITTTTSTTIGGRGESRGDFRSSGQHHTHASLGTDSGYGASESDGRLYSPSVELDGRSPTPTSSSALVYDERGVAPNNRHSVHGLCEQSVR
jgi:hypothetical protein